MNDNICYIIARAGISGGTASLSYRLISSFKEKGLNCIFFCYMKNDENNMSLFQKNNIEIVYKNDTKFKEHFISIQDRFSSFRFIVFSPEEYLLIEKLSLRFDKIEGCFYYCVHDFAFCRPGSSKIFELLSKYRYRAFVQRLFKNEAIAFMSKQCTLNASSLLSLEFPEAEKYTFNLPIKTKNWNDSEINKRKRHTPFSISTITRMDFPFKGYILGLIEWFRENAEKYNLKLTIIGDGNSSNELMKTMDSLSNNIRSRITYIKNVPYDKLYTVFSKTDLFLGMGTTLIDAANEMTLAVPVKAYTRDLLVDGLFCDNIDSLVAEQGSTEFNDLFRRIFYLSDNEYVDLLHQQFGKFVGSYDIERMTLFLLERTYKKHLINRPHIFYMESISKMSSLFHKVQTLIR